MIITFAPLAAGPAWGTPVTLCSGAAEEGPSDWKIDGRSTVEVVAVLAGDSPKIYDRGNRSHNVAFKVTHQNADVKAGQAKTLNLSADLPNYGLLKFIPDSPGEPDGTAYYAIAGLLSFHIEEIGLATIHDFIFICGLFTTTEPDPG